MIDDDKDGIINKEDLHDILASLGQEPTSEELDSMLADAPGPLNFTMFLTLFGEKLSGTDPEDVIKNAFGCFDLDNTGFISEDKLKECLTTMGDRFTDEEVEQLFRNAPVNAEGLFDYRAFTHQLKHGSKEDDYRSQ